MPTTTPLRVSRKSSRLTPVTGAVNARSIAVTAEPLIVATGENVAVGEAEFVQVVDIGPTNVFPTVSMTAAAGGFNVST